MVTLSKHGKHDLLVEYSDSVSLLLENVRKGQIDETDFGGFLS